MRVASDRMSQAQSICRRLAGAQRELLVFVDHKGRLDSCDAHSPRHAAMVDSPSMSGRIVGVFDGLATAAEILASAAETCR